jgi:hypothetical protein
VRPGKQLETGLVAMSMKMALLQSRTLEPARSLCPRLTGHCSPHHLLLLQGPPHHKMSLPQLVVDEDASLISCWSQKTHSRKRALLPAACTAVACFNSLCCVACVAASVPPAIRGHTHKRIR